MGRVRPTGNTGESGQAGSGDLIFRSFRSRQDVGKIDPECSPIIARPSRRGLDVDVVDADAAMGLVDHGWADRPDPTQGVHLVGALESDRNQGVALVVRGELVVRVIGAPKQDVLVGRDQKVAVDLALTLILRVGKRALIVLCSLMEPGSGRRIGVHDPNTVGTQLGLRNDVARIGNATCAACYRAGTRHINLRAGRIPGIRDEQLAEVALAHQRGGHGHGLSSCNSVADPILVDEEEELVPQAI